MMTQKNAPYLFIAVLFALGAVMPLVLKQYHLNMLTEIIVFALYAVSYNLLLAMRACSPSATPCFSAQGLSPSPWP